MLDQKNDTDHWGFAFDFMITLRREITNEVRKKRFIHVIRLFKGTVDPKMAILSLFIHSHAVQNMYDIISSVGHKRWYSGEMWFKIDPTDLPVWTWKSASKISTFRYLLLFQIQKKVIQVWNDMIKLNFILGWIPPFN